MRIGSRWRYLQTTDDLMSSIDDQSSLARLLQLLSVWSRGLALWLLLLALWYGCIQRLVSSRVRVCNALWVSNFCRAMHFTRPSRVGSGLAWSGLVCSWRRFLFTQHISRSTDDNNVCVCMSVSVSMSLAVCVCGESGETQRAAGKSWGRGGSVCRKMLIAQLKSLSMSKAPSRARSPLCPLSGGGCWQLKVRCSVRFGSGLAWSLGLLCSCYAAEDRLTKAPN